MKNKRVPYIFIFSGPGGAGKTTLIKRLFRKKNIKDNFLKGITYTTRQIRPKEKEGKDYFFVTKDDFLKLKKNNFFLENQKVLDNYYGTPRYFYTQAKNQGKDLILCIDVKGGIYLKNHFKGGKIITLFITTPTEQDLYDRLNKRVENREIRDRRIALAKEEIKVSLKYDYLVVNKTIEAAIKQIEEIITKELNWR